jgi:hypothetical protein
LKLTSYGKRLLSKDEINRVIGIVGGWSFTKARCPCSWGIPERCLQDVKPIPNDWKGLQGHPGGLEHLSTQAQDRLIVLQAWRQQLLNATTLCNDFMNATGVLTGVLVSTQTVKKKLHDAGLR